MADHSKGRLHCCGGHGDRQVDRPTGLDLVLGDGGLSAYGTGDNVDSACIILTDVADDGSAVDTSHSIRMYADVLARGANVTVLLPNVQQFHQRDDAISRTRSKRQLDELDNAKQTPANRSDVPLSLDGDAIFRFARFLKTSMQVTHLAILVMAQSADLAAEGLKFALDERMRGTLSCIALTCGTTDLPFIDPRLPFVDGLLLPVAVIELSERREVEPADETQLNHVSCDRPVLQRLTRSNAPRDFAGHAIEHDGHSDITHELIYWLKKHLHDWS